MQPATVRERSGDVVNIYIDSTIKAPRRGDGSGIYLVEWVDDKNPEKFKTWPAVLFDLPDTTENTTVLIALIEALCRFTKQTKIRIFTKSKWLFQTLESRKYAEWRSQKWRGASENIIKNHELLEILIPLLEKHEWTITTDEHSYDLILESELKKWQKA